MSDRRGLALALVALLVPAAALAAEEDAPRRAIEATLERIRAEHGLPAIGVAVIDGGKTVVATAVGVRSLAADERVGPDDRFHLGSCTKAMTATLFEVVEGAPRRDVPLATVLPDLADRMLAAYRPVTIDHLLAHRAGLPHTVPDGASLMEMHRFPGSARDQRRRYVELIVATKPVGPAGETFAYSNAGYVVAGLALEEATGKSWEELMRERLFRPLGMTTGGFGAPARAGRLDQPWAHRWDGERLVPVPPGPLADNPLALGPAGTVHASMADWARFVAAHLDGGPLLTREQRAALHAPPFGGSYAGGWAITERAWAEEGKSRTVLTHAGSNTLNFCVAWLAPARRFAVLVATNAGGPAAPTACDAVAAAMVKRYSGR